MCITHFAQHNLPVPLQCAHLYSTVWVKARLLLLAAGAGDPANTGKDSKEPPRAAISRSRGGVRLRQLGLAILQAQDEAAESCREQHRLGKVWSLALAAWLTFLQGQRGTAERFYEQHQPVEGVHVGFGS
jgi:hypothetical protein